MISRMIQNLMETNIILNQTLLERGTGPVSTTSYSASSQNNYCLTHSCYTPTEFALYGVCIGVAGIFIAVFVVNELTKLCIDLNMSLN